VNSVVLTTASRLLVGLMVLFSFFLLWRGHNEPGGGFIGGLVAAAALVVYGKATDAKSLRALLRIDPQPLAVCGLVVTIVSGLLPLVQGGDFLAGLWLFIGATPDSKGLALGTPLLFDVGVYLAVVGGVVGMVLALEESEPGRSSPGEGAAPETVPGEHAP